MPLTRLLIATVTLSMLATAPAHADPGHDPVVVCLFHRQSNVLVYTGAAHVPPAHATGVASLSILCTFENEIDRYTIVNFTPAPVVAIAGAGPMKPGVMVVCGVAVATYTDGHTGTGTFGEC